MSDHEDRMGKFDPEDINACASEWQDYKRMFEIHLDAKGLHEAVGRRKVGQLLKCMGREHIATYDTFTWAHRIPAVAEDVDNAIPARPEVPAEDRYDLETVFTKFDAHFGVHRYRSIKRQEFLSCTRGDKQSIQSFIAELKRKSQYCDYGDREEGFIVDMLINRVHDAKCTEKLMELSDDQLTLTNAIRVCRQVELTNSHLKSLSNTKSEEHVHKAYRESGRSRNRSSRRPPSDRRHQSRVRVCDRCCRQHDGDERCAAIDRYCGTCGKKGHYQRSPLCSMKDDRSRPRDFRQFRGNRDNRSRGRGQGHRGRGRHVYYADDDDAQYDYDDNVLYAHYDYDDNVPYNAHDVTTDEYDEMCESFDAMGGTKKTYVVKHCVSEKQGDVDVEVKKSHDVKVKKPDVRDISSNVDDGNTQNVPDDCNTQNVPDDCNTQNVKDVESTVQSSELRLMC